MAERKTFKVVDDPAVTKALDRFGSCQFKKWPSLRRLGHKVTNYRRTEDGWEHWDILDRKGNKIGGLSSSPMHEEGILEALRG